MAKKLDAASLTAAWQRGMAGAGAAYTEGINNTTVNPMALAATPEAMQKYQDGVARSIASGKRRDALNAANPQTWKANAVQFGAANLANGARKASPKFQAAMQKWGPIYAQASQAAAAVQGPKGMATALAKQQAALQVLMSAAGSA